MIFLFIKVLLIPISFYLFSITCFATDTIPPSQKVHALISYWDSSRGTPIDEDITQFLKLFGAYDSSPTIDEVIDFMLRSESMAPIDGSEQLRTTVNQDPEARRLLKSYMTDHAAHVLKAIDDAKEYLYLKDSLSTVMKVGGESTTDAPHVAIPLLVYSTAIGAAGGWGWSELVYDNPCGMLLGATPLGIYYGRKSVAYLQTSLSARAQFKRVLASLKKVREEARELTLL